MPLRFKHSFSESENFIDFQKCYRIMPQWISIKVCFENVKNLLKT